MNWIRVKKKKK